MLTFTNKMSAHLSSNLMSVIKKMIVMIIMLITIQQLCEAFGFQRAIFIRSATHSSALSKVIKPRGGGGREARRWGEHYAPFSASASVADNAAAANIIVTVPTKPIEGMKPGTSGLRKKVEVWQGQSADTKKKIDDGTTTYYYLENFIQSLINVAKEKSVGKGQVLDTLIVAGDGRYYNAEAMQIIFRILAANNISNIWVPQHGIMSTPAVSAAIRTYYNGGKKTKAKGAIVLTASHNPGGPGQDFGIKYNEEYGQPADEKFTDALYEESLQISSFLTLKGTSDVDLSANAGTTFDLTPLSTVTIIDPFDCYVDTLKQCFDFEKLRTFVQRKEFSVYFDGMHGAGGPFAERILVHELGLPKESLLRCDPRPDFGQCHPDPNLTYASELVLKMGLNPDGSEKTSDDTSALPTLGAANDGDGDRNLIAGAGCFVTPSDSLAIICDNWEAIPHFARAGGPNGVARSMPSSAALDVVAKARGIPCFSTPTGWKYFGNLMGSKEVFGKHDYTPFLCGEESFGTGSDHIREKDGLWALLAWMSILMRENERVPIDEALIGVKDIVRNHWAKYGRHFYCRYDYDGVDSDAANTLVSFVRKNLLRAGAVPPDASGIDLVDGIEFSYTDPVDGSIADKQGLILHFTVADGLPARVVFRLSGTGSAGATIRMYLERYEKNPKKHGEAAPIALKSLAQRALALVNMVEITGRDTPTVIT